MQFFNQITVASCIPGSADTTTAGFSCNESVRNIGGEFVCTGSCIIGSTTYGAYTCVTPSIGTENYCSVGGTSSTAVCNTDAQCTGGTCNLLTLQCSRSVTTTVFTCVDKIVDGRSDCRSLANGGYAVIVALLEVHLLYAST
uniref:EB domain-containing protein n=1 Tax=Rhabditophanes sp. KR3021 TaxID=114890 RepID=A0AC35TVI8_9BILA